MIDPLRLNIHVQHFDNSCNCCKGALKGALKFLRGALKESAEFLRGELKGALNFLRGALMGVALS